VSTATVLLDKDGTLIENEPMNVDPRRIRLTPGAGKALRRLSRAGFRIGVVSNQPGVAFGQFPEDALRPVESRLRELLLEHHTSLDAFLYCPHHPRGNLATYAVRCDCRKPAPGLLVRAMSVLRAAPARTWMIGDILDDIEAAHRAGCRAILFDSGGESEWLATPARTPDFVTRDFGEAADIIIGAMEAA
jgi:histidinol-phosphate phosphatase family protein